MNPLHRYGHLRSNWPKAAALGICAGLWVGMAWLMCASAWLVPSSTRGVSAGGLVFYGVWVLCVLLALALPAAHTLRIYAWSFAFGCMGAALGSLCRAPAMVWCHPSVLGVNLVLGLLGAASLGWALRYAPALKRGPSCSAS